MTVFDLENKFVAFSGTFEEGAREVFSQWGHIYVLTNDGKVRIVFVSCAEKDEFLKTSTAIRLEEKPTATKLEMIIGEISMFLR